MKRVYRRVNASTVFFIGISIFAGLAIGYRIYGEISIGELLEVLVLVFLVGVTVIYTRETGKIARLNKQQVEATRETIEEMKGQTLSMTMPVVLPECWSGQEGSSDGIFVALQNMGRGPALNIGGTIVVDEPEAVEDAWKKGTGGVSVRAYFNLAELGMGENTAGHPQFVELGLHRNERFSVVVECHDVYENDIGMVRSYHVVWDASGKHGLVLLRSLGARRIDYRIRRWP